ncbi:MAG: hypothetical protein ACYTX0_27820 [Nostoc sp.]
MPQAKTFSYRYMLQENPSLLFSSLLFERLRQREASLSETRTRTPTTSLRVKDLGFGNQDS